jgi:hypothetical protein
MQLVPILISRLIQHDHVCSTRLCLEIGKVWLGVSL